MQKNEIDNERKKWESDEAWELRRAFMLAHYEDYSKLQLQCLSQLFVNVNLLGCEYSDSLMEKIKDLGRGIHVDMDRKKSGNFVKASSAKKRQAVTATDLVNASGESKKTKSEGSSSEGATARINELKKCLASTPHHLTGEQMLSMATNNNGMKWFYRTSGTKVEIFIDRFIALRHTFSKYCVDVKECSLNALIESLLSTKLEVSNNDEIFYDGESPDNCYSSSMKRNLMKIRSNLKGQTTLKGLTKALEAVNLSILQNTIKLEGWSQQLDLVTGDTLMASRILSREECTRPKMAQIADRMAAEICQNINMEFSINVSSKLQSSLEFELHC